MANVAIFPGSMNPDRLDTPDQETVAKLEGMLEDARAGRLRAIAYATVDHEGTILTGWVGEADQFDIIAGLSILQFRFHSAKEAED